MLKSTKLYQELQKRESKYLEGINKVYKYASELLPKINRIFANYTGHGVEHSVNVMDYMYDLVTDISKMSDLEITCLIDAALLHDIGMAANEEEIASIKRDALIYHGRKYSVIYDKYQDENIALQECVRPVHGERALQHIMQMKKELFVIPEFTNCNFQEELAKICQAHTMNQEWLLQNLDYSQVKGKDELNAQYVAMLLRVADYLDIDERRAPIELYRFLAPVGFGDEEWRQHYIIENREKVVKGDASGSSSIVLYGNCNDAKIHRKFLRYLSGISEELLWCTSYTRKHFKEKYWILLQPQIDNRIVTKGFEISDLKMQMDYHAVMTLLMGENVYGDRRCGLRELMQNAMDACRVMAEEAEHMEKYRYVPYLPEIQVILDYKAGKMIVMDNGIGMGDDVLTKYFLNIGRSYYRSDEFLFQGKSYRPIGTFGIGFLACFMLSDSVVVETKHYMQQEGFTIELEKDSEFVCKKDCVSMIRDSGTAIILNLESVLAAFDGKEESIKGYLERTFLDQGVQVWLIAIDSVRREENLKLEGLEDRNPNGIKLDSYLNGISACWEFQFDGIKVSKKFSDLFPERIYMDEEQIYAVYDYETGKLCLKDMEGEELIKYIENDQIMVLKIIGIKEEEKGGYEACKQWDSLIDFLPSSASKAIYFPIKYDESLCEYYEKDNFYYNKSGVIWHVVRNQLEKYVFGNGGINKILRQCKLKAEWDRIDMGIFSVISVGNNRYIECYDWRSLSDAVKNEIYWRGIRLEGIAFLPNIRLFGVNCDKCVVNISNKEIFPNVARDRLMNGVEKLVRLAVERAALQYAIDNLTEDKELQIALQTYINNNYPEDNPYYARNDI